MALPRTTASDVYAWQWLGQMHIIGAGNDVCVSYTKYNDRVTRKERVRETGNECSESNNIVVRPCVGSSVQ
jgi:hypothetical protein